MFPFADQRVSPALTGMLNGANPLFATIGACYLVARAVARRGGWLGRRLSRNRFDGAAGSEGGQQRLGCGDDSGRLGVLKVSLSAWRVRCNKNTARSR